MGFQIFAADLATNRSIYKKKTGGTEKALEKRNAVMNNGVNKKNV